MDAFGKSKVLLFFSEKAAERIKAQQPMDRAVVKRVKVALIRKGVALEQSQEIDKYLLSTGKEAITFTDGTMLMHTNVSASGFFEELIHYGQIIHKRHTLGDEHNRLLLEIEAQKRLIENHKAYQITDYEITILQQNLKEYSTALENLKGADGHV